MTSVSGKSAAAMAATASHLRAWLTLMMRQVRGEVIPVGDTPNVPRNSPDFNNRPRKISRPSRVLVLDLVAADRSRSRTSTRTHTQNEVINQTPTLRKTSTQFKVSTQGDAQKFYSEGHVRDPKAYSKLREVRVL